MILIVEDNEDNRKLMAYLLRDRGHEVELAVDGADGVRRTAELQPHLVLMDIQMPVMDGFEAIRAIRADRATAGVRVVAVTASAMVGDQDKVMSAGFDGYIAKPIAPESFGDQVRRHLEDPGAEQAEHHA